MQKITPGVISYFVYDLFFVICVMKFGYIFHRLELTFTSSGKQTNWFWILYFPSLKYFQSLTKFMKLQVKSNYPFDWSVNEKNIWKTFRRFSTCHEVFIFLSIYFQLSPFTWVSKHSINLAGKNLNWKNWRSYNLITI